MAPPPDTGPVRSIARLLVRFLAVNLSIFLAGRIAFLLLFVTGATAGEVARVLLYGIRLDLGLLGLELAAAAVLTIATLAVRLRLLTGAAAGLTILNALTEVADLRFYAERNQHLGELLLANITDPGHIAAELRSFAATSPVVAILVLAAIAAAVYGVVRLVRRTPRASWRLRKGLLFLFPACLLLGLTSQEPVVSKDRRGFEIDWVNAVHYSLLDRLPLNEAVANPLQEILVVHLPLTFADVPPPRLDPAVAERLCLDLLGRRPADPEYPLTTEVDGRDDLGLSNVVIVQVEGLTASVLDQRVGEEWATPFLRDLAGRGISFRNLVHSYANTAGGVFATATGMPRTSLGEKHHRVFTPTESATPYSTLARCLDLGRAWFFAGFRQSAHHYRAFAGNQGFVARTYDELSEALAGKEAQDAESILGIHDGPMMEEALSEILAGPRPFAAHLMTADTHFPWPVPDSVTTPFDEADRRLRAFRYLDDSVRKFVERLEADPEAAGSTLVAVLADHTNVTFGEDPMERLRIPLILWSRSIEEAGLGGTRDRMGSEEDVLPTILGLIAGRHPFAGLGSDLLGPEVPRGVISATRNETFYFRDGFALHLRRQPEMEELLTYRDRKLGAEDVSAAHPGVHERLRREYDALYETARRLATERRVLRHDKQDK